MTTSLEDLLPERLRGLLLPVSQRRRRPEGYQRIAGAIMASDGPVAERLLRELVQEYAE